MLYRAAPRPARCQLGDLVPRANPFPKGFCSAASVVGFGQGQAGWAAAREQDFGGSRACSSCSAMRCRSTQIAALCPRAEQQGHGLAGPRLSRSRRWGQGCSRPAPHSCGLWGKSGAMAEGSDSLGVPLILGLVRGRGKRLCGCNAGWAGKGGGGCVLPRRTVLWIQLPWKLRCCPRCC